MNSIFELRRYGIASHRRWVLLLILTVLLIPAKATPGTGGFGIGNSDAGSEETNNFVAAADREISLSDSAASVSLNGNTLVIENADGTTITQTLDPDEIVAVTTASGEDYLIDNSTSTVYTQASAGGSAPAGGSSSVRSPASSGEVNYQVSFAAGSQNRFGFDAYTNTRPAANYRQYNLGGNTVHTSWKSTESGQLDKLVATVEGEPSDSVFFTRESLNMVMQAPGNSPQKKQLMITGLGHEDEDELLAYSLRTTRVNDTTTRTENILAGKVSLVSYDKQLMDVWLVPVNGSYCPDAGQVRSYLDTIYKPAIVQWNVRKLDPGLEVDLPQATLINNEDEDDNMNYSPEMKDVIRAMKDHELYESESLYLFFFNGAVNRNAKGYMPLKHRYGFIYQNGQSDAELRHTIAHELGHGPFRLRHTFSPEHEFTQPVGTTDNLMDYSAETGGATPLGNTHIYKSQWDKISRPEFMVLALLEDEGEGAYGYTANDEMLVLTHLEKFRYGYMFGEEIEISINVVFEDNFYARDITLGDGKSYKFLKLWQDNFPGKVNFIPEKKDAISSWSLSISDGVVDVVSYMYGGYQDRNFQLACHEDNLIQFASYLFPDKSNATLYKQQYNKVITDHFINAERSDILDNLNEFPKGMYENLTVSNRIELLAKLADGTMNSGQFNQESTTVDEDYSEEGFALSIIETCPTSESSTFITELKGKSGLLRALDEGFDDTEYFGADGNQSEFAQSMFNHVLSATQAKVNIDDNSRIYHYVDPLLIQFPEADRSKINNQGEIELDLRLTATETGNNNKHAFDEWVLVYFEKDVPEIGYKKGDIKPVPAYFYHYLIRKEINESYRQSISLAIDLASMAIAIGEIKAGVKGIRYAIAVADIAASIPNLAISSFEEEIGNLPGGKDFIHDFRVATALIALVDVGTIPLEGFFKVADGELTRIGRFMETNEDALKAIDSDIATTTRKIIGNLPSVRQLETSPAYLSSRIISSNLDKTTTVIGKWKDELELLFKELTEADINIYSMAGKTENNGGFNMLSLNMWDDIVKKLEDDGIVEGMKAFDDYIWEKYNKIWIEDAMKRGDDILIWSNPKLDINKVKEFDDVEDGLSFFGRELEFIESNASKYGYNFTEGVTNGVFTK